MSIEENTATAIQKIYEAVANLNTTGSMEAQLNKNQASLTLAENTLILTYVNATLEIYREVDRDGQRCRECVRYGYTVRVPDGKMVEPYLLESINKLANSNITSDQIVLLHTEIKDSPDMNVKGLRDRHITHTYIYIQDDPKVTFNMPEPLYKWVPVNHTYFDNTLDHLKLAVLALQSKTPPVTHIYEKEYPASYWLKKKADEMKPPPRRSRSC